MRILIQKLPLGILFSLTTILAQAQGGTIYGFVSDRDGPVEDATIRVGSQVSFSGKTGKFSMKIPQRNSIIRVSHAGYEEITRNIRFEARDSIFFEFVLERIETLEEVIVLASRFNKQRSNLSTPVPIDVIPSKHLLETGQNSLTQMLQFAAPSFNASRQIVNEPVTLRGLDPDQLLVLVNGKPYHNMSFVNFGGVRGILGKGAVSNDLNAVPFSAVEKIEILRDGASAQYGSDAIAGVINIQLKNNTDKTWVQVHTGQFYRNDGESINIEINRGVTLYNKSLPADRQGFLNVSASFRFQNPTYRGGLYTGTVYKAYPPFASPADSMEIRMQDDSIVAARKFDRGRVSNAGTSEHRSVGWVINGGYPLNRQAELFWSAGLNFRKTVFTTAQILPRMAAFINPELYPDGTKPRPGNRTRDIWAISGIRGETGSNWHWEYSWVYGSNNAKYDNTETNNASQFYAWGKSAPTSFYTGKLIYGQLLNDFHLSKKILAGTEKEINLGIGAEWKLENFQIGEGEEASWKNYQPAGTKLGGSGGLVFTPRDAVHSNRTRTAVYTEMETALAGRLLTSLAMRYEYYSDFGSNLAVKLAVRYKINEKLSVRSSVSNGFRAPSLQQRYYSLTRTDIINIGGAFVPVNSGIFRNNSEVATALGIPSLQAERSVNLGLGLTAAISPGFSFTLDGYLIRIKNRIVLSGRFGRSNRDVDSLLTGLTNVSQVQFFTNAINTNTIGLDLVITRSWKINQNKLEVILAANITQTRLYGGIGKAGYLKADSLNSNTLFNTEDRTRLEKGQPSDKIILSVSYVAGKTKLIFRNTRFGKTAIAPAYVHPVTRITSFLYESFSPKLINDFSFGYFPKSWLTVTLGANNIFNVYPDRLRDYRNTAEGLYVYGQEATPFGFNGGYYFVSVEVKW